MEKKKYPPKVVVQVAIASEAHCLDIIPKHRVWTVSIHGFAAALIDGCHAGIGHKREGPASGSWTIIKKLLDVCKMGTDFERIMEVWRRGIERGGGGLIVVVCVVNQYKYSTRREGRGGGATNCVITHSMDHYPAFSCKASPNVIKHLDWVS